MNLNRIRRGFDILAPLYDRLARLVFGKAIEQAQLSLLDELQADAEVLIIGGGTGSLLKPLFEAAHPRKVWYVDISGVMLQTAQNHLAIHLPEQQARVQFVQGSQDDLPEGLRVDVVITPFFLDLFSEAELIPVFERLHHCLRPGGQWYVIDFFLPRNRFRPIARGLIWLMYRFFRLAAGISGQKLLDFDPCFLQKNYRLLTQTLFFRQMIRAQLWRK